MLLVSPLRVFEKVGGPNSSRLGRIDVANAGSYVSVGEQVTMVYDHRDVQALPLLNAEPGLFVIREELDEAVTPESGQK